MNRGVAPAYHRCRTRLALQVEGGGVAFEQPVESDNRAWMPGAPAVETYALDVPASLPRGRYRLLLGLAHETREGHRPIELALAAERRAGGRYRIADVAVE